MANIKTSHSEHKLEHYLVALLVFSSMSPFFLWGSFGALAFVAILALMAIDGLLQYRTRISSHRFILMLLIFYLFLYLTIPIREEDSFSLKNPFAIIAFIFILIVYSSDFEKYLSALRRLFFIASIFCLISWLLFMLKVPFPQVEVTQDFRPQSTDKYYWYYGFIYLNSQSQSFGVIHILRNVGWFGEPGHFGLYLCMMLLTQKNILAGKENKVFLLTILTTFSLSSFIFLFFIAIVKSRWYKVLPVLTLLLFGLFSLPESIVNNYFLNKVSSPDVLDARASLPFNIFELELTHLLLGGGRDFLKVNGYFSSDILGFITKYGVISVALALLPVCFVVYRNLVSRNFYNAVICIVFFAFIFSHRSWMIDTLYFWFFICCLYNTKISHVNYSKRLKT